jgi:4-hydroxy-tetrahydrodipicolinate synthase
MKTQFYGIITPLVTPFEQDGVTVSERAIYDLVEYQVKHGVHALFAAGTTGESAALDDSQWQRLINATVQAARQRAPVIAGVSTPTTGGAIKRARQAAGLGAAAITATTPYYFPPSQPDIIRHYRAILDATPLPLVIYNIPHLTKVPIKHETYLELARLPQITGIKDSAGDVTAFRRLLLGLREQGRDDLSLLMGTDILIDVIMLLGAHGVVPSLGNVAPGVLVAAWEAARTGNWAESRTHLEKAIRLTQLYQVNKNGLEGGLIAGLKCALSLLGIECGPPAAPMRALDASECRQIEAILREAGLLSGQQAGQR